MGKADDRRQRMLSFVIIFFLAGATRAEVSTVVEIESEIRYRYARTEVRSTMTNRDKWDNEITFAMTLPEPAFISNFTILAGGQEHVATVMDADEARKKYNDTKEIGLTSGIVSEEFPKERKFSIEVNVEAQQEITFKLTYEERLERENGHYKYQLYLETPYKIDSLNVTVDIKESLPITELCLPLSNSDTSCSGAPPHTEASVNWISGSREVRVLYKPADTGALEAGLSVMYSVEDEENELQVVCGHFVHTFCPDHHKSAKHVVFILDTSGSMTYNTSGIRRLEQLKSAMENMIKQKLNEDDYFSILSYSTSVKKFQVSSYNKLGVFKASDANKLEAVDYVYGLTAGGLTNINQALMDGITLSEEAKIVFGENIARSIVFLTDGDPTAGETNVENIVNNLIKRNTEKIPILTIGFGTQTNFRLLQRISGLTDSLAKMIYDGSEAGIQLQDFFYKIERPTLRNVKLRYIGNVNQTSLTKQREGQMYLGGEMVTMGRTLMEDEDGYIDLEMTADSRNGPFTYHRSILQSETLSESWSECSMIKRYYAYLQIKQSITLGKRTNSKVHLERAKNMSLANNFVTPLTSLVVVVDTPDTPTTTTTTITTTTPFSWGTVTYPTVRHTYRANSPSRLRMKEQVYRFINNDSGRTNSPVRKPEIIEIDET